VAEPLSMAYRCNQLGRGAKRKDQSLCGAQCGEVMKTCNSAIAAFYSFPKVCVCRQCPRSAAPGGRCRASSPWQSSPENTYSTQPRSDAPESPLGPSHDRRSRAAATVNPPPSRRRPAPPSGPRARPAGWGYTPASRKLQSAGEGRRAPRLKRPHRPL